MKISKTACILILGATFATNAMAYKNLSDVRTAYYYTRTQYPNFPNLQGDGLKALIGTAREYIILLSVNNPSPQNEDDRIFISTSLKSNYSQITEGFKLAKEWLLNESDRDKSQINIDEIRNWLDNQGINTLEKFKNFTLEQLKNKEQLEKDLDSALIDFRKKLSDNLNKYKDELEKIVIEKEKASAADLDTYKKALESTKDAIVSIAKEMNQENKADMSLIISKDKELSNGDIIKAILDVDAYKFEGLDGIKKLASKEDESISQVVSNFGQNSVISTIQIGSELNTATRLAKLSNPYNENLALAYAISNLKNENFADNDGYALSSLVREYTNRFNYDNNLWATINGAKGNIKDGANPSVYGFTLGYDKAFDDFIFGGFVTYAKSKAKNEIINNKADNYQLGVYSRSYIKNYEIDFKFSTGIAKNKNERNTILANRVIVNDSKYNSYFNSLDINYGYVAKLDSMEGLFFKPSIGLNFSHIKSNSFRENGELAVKYNATTSKALSLRVSGEIRKYLENGSYFYVTPGIEKEIYKNANNSVVTFIGSNNDIIFSARDRKSTFLTLQTGADFTITKSLSANANFGVKASAQEKYCNGTLGIKYKF
ncbi:autotransporter outer membrane beta-barrel domain-containing protein [Campylobacter mucosalis]|uniref:Putative autotransporter beta-domain protein n=1 Tax=Campylobacter mucosalis CCUG 21559 TaxID=1032067 RepID=A0A6G5QHI1_9BACT|nr:autotransporter outer membrane beta-barrel domain-containing protein [Campylobacter mucosalis]QCD45138.1 putative autotransporter beta-domain protein [Campylobacter mucosalis CCUG 21559]